MFAWSEHACDQWHSSRKFTPLTGLHCKLRPNTEGQLIDNCLRITRLVVPSDWSAWDVYSTVRSVFGQDFALGDAIGPHASCLLEANKCVANDIPLGCSIILPVGPVTCVQTLKGEDTGEYLVGNRPVSHFGDCFQAFDISDLFSWHWYLRVYLLINRPFLLVCV
jgi:hypothetical protein